MTTPTPTTLTPDQMLAMISRLQAENAKLAASQAEPKRLTLKVSEKGALSIYGLGKFPVTLYRSQWERLLEPATTKLLTDFISANDKLLAVKA